MGIMKRIRTAWRVLTGRTTRIGVITSIGADKADGLWHIDITCEYTSDYIVAIVGKRAECVDLYEGAMLYCA